MPSIVWPGSLPAYPLYEGYQETLGANTIRSAMEVGPAKLRRRGTAAVHTFTVSFGLTHDQAAELRDFFNDDTYGGSLSFELAHPTTEETLEMRFASAPMITRQGPNAYRANLTLEALP